jgi:FtsH-binding integral membrane protein
MNEALDFIMDATKSASGGEIFIPKLLQINIVIYLHTYIHMTLNLLARLLVFFQISYATVTMGGAEIIEEICMYSIIIIVQFLLCVWKQCSSL